MMITLQAGKFGTYLLVPNDPQVESRLVQTDWDYPGVASTFGWSPCHPETDGTVDCPVCGKSVSELIQEAGEYLDEHIGDSVEDPGYFDGGE